MIKCRRICSDGSGIMFCTKPVRSDDILHVSWLSDRITYLVKGMLAFAVSVFMIAFVSKHRYRFPVYAIIPLVQFSW